MKPLNDVGARTLYPLVSHQQTILGCVVDLVQERYTSPGGLDQGWRNVYCYLYPLPIDSNGTLQIKYIKFIDFGTAFDLSYDTFKS